jgi:glutamate-1-semialdehyde 2,1-aminomutase
MQDTCATTLDALLATEQQRFIDTHPQSIALAQHNQGHYLFGVPLHWMRDWPSPATLFVQHAQGCQLTCVDGHTYSDFCLGDTGAMFGHSPAPVAQAIATQAQQGLTYMLPSSLSTEVGALLQQRFGLPLWQLALSASDANRFVIKWARAITQRPMLLVFDGCYHGAVDDTLVDLNPRTGHTEPRLSTLGSVHNHASYTRVVPFNNLSALEHALQDQQVALLLAEPALTNFGLVPPNTDFWQQAQALCTRYGTLLALDETHTLSSGVGGYTHQHALQPDFWVAGKAVAGGLPCAVYGFTHAIGQRMQETKQKAPEGHSGIGTTLSGNALTMAALHAALTQLHTPPIYAQMQDTADALETGLCNRIQQHALPWTVTRLGARMELQFMPESPQNADDVRHGFQPQLETLMHLFMLNRGIVLTPFHSMMLCSPATQQHHVEQLLHIWDEWIKTLDLQLVKL